jgi:hypothetical protein
MAVLKKKTSKLRKPFYETSDKIGGLLSVSSELKHLYNFIPTLFLEIV